MKKWFLALALMGALVVSLSSVGSVFAQSSTPTAPVNGSGTGLMHDEMVAIYAEAFGMTADDLDTRLDAGETLADVAYSIGMTATEFRDLAVSLRAKVIALAVENGTITQDQADWMTSRWKGQNAGNGAGQAAGNGGGMRAGNGARGGNAGTGIGRNANPDCPYLSD